LKSNEAEELKKKLKEFEKKINEFRKDFLENLPFKYNERMTIDDVNDCYRQIMTYKGKLTDLEEEANEYNK